MSRYSHTLDATWQTERLQRVAGPTRHVGKDALPEVHQVHQLAAEERADALRTAAGRVTSAEELRAVCDALGCCPADMALARGRLREVKAGRAATR